MAPNCAANLRDKNVNRSQNNINTESIVRHIYAYLLNGEYLFEDLPVLNSEESKIFEALKNVSGEFKSRYSDTMSELTGSLEVTPKSIDKVVYGVSNELFCEGITWSRIATFYVFASVTVAECLQRGFPDFIVHTVLNCILKFTHDFLDKWISDHGGWEGFEEDFAKGNKKQESEKTVMNDQDQGTSWAKTALYKTVTVLGTLAYIANIADPQNSSL